MVWVTLHDDNQGTKLEVLIEESLPTRLSLIQPLEDDFNEVWLQHQVKEAFPSLEIEVGEWSMAEGENEAVAFLAVKKLTSA